MSRAHRPDARDLEIATVYLRAPTACPLTATSPTSVGPPNKRGRRMRILAVHRDEPDPKKLADALIAIVLERHRAQHGEDHHSDG
jgi:hypothetical protein